MVEVRGETDLPRARPHHLLHGPNDGSARGLAHGAQASRQGGPREARTALQPAPELGSLLDTRHAHRDPVARRVPVSHGGRRSPYSHGWHNRRAEGRRSHARQPHGERRGIDRVGPRPPRGRRGLLLYPAPLPRLRVHHWLPGGLAPGGDDRYVPQVRHRASTGRSAPAAVHVLPGRSAHVRAPARGGGGHERGPVLDPLLALGRNASLGAAGRTVGAGHRRPHDRRLRHDGGLPDPPGITPRLLASTRGARHPLPLHPGAHRRSGKPLPRGCQWRGR